MQKLFLVPLVGLALVASAGVVGATQTCDPLELVCTGDSGTDPYAHCDGTWVDTWAVLYYHQVCVGSDGVTHICAEIGYDGNPATCDFHIHQ